MALRPRAPRIEAITLTNLDREAVSTSALDLTALQRLVQMSPSSRLFGLSNLHAKVFVADEKAAIVTSGNLTRSGLDSNIEYGVLLRQPRIVRAVREDMLSFTPLGNQIDADTLAKLLPLESELRLARENINRSPTPDAQRRFDTVMREARIALVSAQLGNRTAHAAFGDAIQFVLAKGPQSTKIIEQEVRQLMPALCDDNEYFMIKESVTVRLGNADCVTPSYISSGGVSSPITPARRPGHSYKPPNDKPSTARSAD